MIENIRLSDRARQQLITIKRHTRISNWNVLCRWAFCLSLKEETVPPDQEIPADSSVEMSWRTFAGAHERLYWAMLLLRARKDGVQAADAAVARYFRLHLHRGISYLAAAQLRSVRDLIKLAA